MKFIDKAIKENRIEGLRINKRIINLCWQDNCYVNLNYDIIDKSELSQHLVNEQGGYCCYCMRRLHLQNEGNHKKNVTLEHVIPHKITEEEWINDRDKYRKFGLLDNRNITVCYNGVVPDNTRKFGMPPFPHFLAYDNLVASCDGLTLNEDSRISPHQCCNNKRGNRYVEPLYFLNNVSQEVSYDKRGHIVCDEEYVGFLNENGVNIMSRFLNDVRLFWRKIADSEYTDVDVHRAEDDGDLRKDIIDDIFTKDSIGHWNFLCDENSKEPWCIFSDYDWFYQYYHA